MLYITIPIKVFSSKPQYGTLDVEEILDLIST